MARWELITKTDDGHKFFWDNQNQSVAIADMSGLTSDKTEGGILTINTDRECNIVKDLKGKLYIEFPVLHESGHFFVIFPLDEVDLPKLDEYIDLKFKENQLTKNLVRNFNFIINQNFLFKNYIVGMYLLAGILLLMIILSKC